MQENVSLDWADDDDDGGGVREMKTIGCKGGGGHQDEEWGGCGRGIQAPMAHGRSTKIISMIKWIRTSRLSIKNSLPAMVCLFSPFLMV